MGPPPRLDDDAGMVPQVRDESLEDAGNLPDPDVIAAEIIEDLTAPAAR